MIIYGKESSVRSVINDQYVAYEQYTQLKDGTVKIRAVSVSSAYAYNPIQADRSLLEICSKGQVVNWKLYDDKTEKTIHDWRCKVKQVSKNEEGEHTFIYVTLERLQ